MKGTLICCYRNLSKSGMIQRGTRWEGRYKGPEERGSRNEVKMSQKVREKVEKVEWKKRRREKDLIGDKNTTEGAERVREERWELLLRYPH